MTADVMEIPLTRGYVALVDAADFDLVIAQGKWSAQVNPTVTYARNNTLYLHTLLTGWNYVDHRNGNGVDNRRSNLRPTNASLNAANKRLRCDSSTGFWSARIGCNGVYRSLGGYGSPEEAARAYDLAALDLFGEFARTNFPREEYGS